MVHLLSLDWFPIPRYRNSCKECGKLFLTTSSVQRHMRFAHLGTKKFECPYCSMPYMFNTGLERHMEAAHGDKRKVNCLKCAQEFPSKAAMRLHMVAAHPPALFCHICRIQFWREYDLMWHKEKRHGWICHFCGTTFSEEKYLTSHMDINHGGKK